MLLEAQNIALHAQIPTLPHNFGAFLTSFHLPYLLLAQRLIQLDALFLKTPTITLTPGPAFNQAYP